MPNYRVCFRCKQPMPAQDNRVCPTCRAALPPEVVKHGDYMREYWRKRRLDPAIKAKESARMMAKHYATPVEERRKRARESMRQWMRVPENRQTVRDRDRRTREEVLAHYGGCCACCGETRYEFLAIDHPNNDGAEHRRSIRGAPIHRWLTRQGLPPGFRVLCHNCNFAREKYAECPHERERRQVT